MTDQRVERVLRVLHIVRYDKKFYADTITLFKSDNRLRNSVIILNTDNCVIEEHDEDLQILTSVKEVKKYLRSAQYDVIYFHSMPINHWKLISSIPKSKKIIWWAWGYDLYQSQLGARPILTIDSYKEETKSLLLNLSRRNRILDILDHIRGAYYNWLINKSLRRIDYFFPVINLEFKMMKEKYPYFKALEFYEKPPKRNDFVAADRPVVGSNILFGNSATYTNNHLDVWKYLSNAIQSSQRCYIPINYGDTHYADTVKKMITAPNVIALTEFLQLEEYHKLQDSCVFFVCGCLRQQAMGNISYAIRHGQKIFLFKDSIIYKYLESLGISVYPIEEIRNDSFEQPLSYKEIVRNISCYNKEFDRRDVIYNSTVEYLLEWVKGV